MLLSGPSSASPLSMESRLSLDTDANRSLALHHQSGLPLNAMYAASEPQSQGRPAAARPPQSGPHRWRVRHKPSASPYDTLAAEERKRLLREQFRPSLQAQQLSPHMPASNSPIMTSEPTAISQSIGPTYEQLTNHTQLTQAHYSHRLTHPQLLLNEHSAPTSNEPLPSGQPLSSSPALDVTMHTGMNFIPVNNTHWNNLHTSVHHAGSRAVETATPSRNIYPGSQAYAPIPSTSARSNDHSPVSAMLPPSTEAVFINSNVGSSNAVLDPSHDCATYRSFFPLQTEAHRRLRVSMHEVMTSAWKLQHELEPTPHDMLQFSQKSVSDDGTAIYKCLLYHKGVACGKTWNRAERILAHLRKEIDLRPFVCDGENDVWYVVVLLGETSADECYQRVWTSILRRGYPAAAPEEC